MRWNFPLCEAHTASSVKKLQAMYKTSLLLELASKLGFENLEVLSKLRQADLASLLFERLQEKVKENDQTESIENWQVI